MAQANTKIVQSTIQGILLGQTEIEAGLVIVLDSPNTLQKFIGSASISSGIGKIALAKAFFETKNPSLSGTNLTGPQASSINSYYGVLKQLLFDVDQSGGYPLFRDGVNQAQTDHASIISTLKNKNQPSHDLKALE